MSSALFRLSVIFFAASFLNAAVAVVAASRRSRRLGLPFLGLLVLSSFWSFVQANEALATAMGAKILWSQFEYVGFAGAPTFFFLFVLKYTRRDNWISKRKMIALAVPPVAIVAMAFTNPLHHFLWTGFSYDTPGTNILTYHHGPGFWIAILYAYGVSFLALLLLLRMYPGSARLIRRQILTIIAGALFPALSGAVYLLDWAPLEGMDPTCLGFTATSLIVFCSLRKYSLLDLVPIGRAILVENIPDGIVVLDKKDRIVDINPAAVRLFGSEASSSGRPAVGDDLAVLLEGRDELASFLGGEGEGHTEVLMERDGPRWFEVAALPLADRRGAVEGRLVVFRDVTERTLAAAEQKKMIERLQVALSEIKRLSGLLPICSVCKKVRDDEGYWTQIEAYIAEHSEADFTHGLCPDCMGKMYGDYVTRKDD